MSHTDKDRPWWVVQFQDGFLVEHDHRYGECIEETLDYARATAGGSYRWGSKHWRHCAKRVERTWHCTKNDPYTYSHYKSYWWKGDGARFRVDQECWTRRCRCDLRRGYRHRYSVDCPTWGRVQCDGHSEIFKDDTIPCVCDDFPTRPTCERGYRYDYRFTRGGSPSWNNRLHWHGPERRRERDDLRDIAREYNAHGDVEDGDFVNRQHRHEGIWNWW